MALSVFRKLNKFNLDRTLAELEEETKLSRAQWIDELNFGLRREKRVTILGSSDRMTFLKNLKITLIENGYNGIIVEQFPHFRYETPRQKVHSFL